MAIFIAYPWLAAVIGAVLLVLGSQRGRRIPVMAGASWLLYALYETGMRLRLLCSGECNIRVDLLLLYPLLLVGTLMAVVDLIRARRASRGGS
ncbi:MAG: hypothetical protein OEV95_03865 [Gemmatimonadota bacterium]|nr:hypothetical protein [Gemmatimonadota bacterium]MDH5282935.1 hypothetical protein [Gemmatimonadota bacterium]